MIAIFLHLASPLSHPRFTSGGGEASRAFFFFLHKILKHLFYFFNEQANLRLWINTDFAPRQSPDKSPKVTSTRRFYVKRSHQKKSAKTDDLQAAVASAQTKDVCTQFIRWLEKCRMCKLCWMLFVKPCKHGMTCGLLSNHNETFKVSLQASKSGWIVCDGCIEVVV